MYTADLEENVDEHGVNYHAFADDTQLSKCCRSDDTSTAVKKLEYCVTDINGCRPTASSLIQRRQNSCGLVPNTASVNWKVVAQLGSDTIEASGYVRVLGVILSSDSSLEKHVSAVSAACFFHPRQICRVRQLLDAGRLKLLCKHFCDISKGGSRGRPGCPDTCPFD